MRRMARVVPIVFAMTVCTAALVRAQTAPAGSGDTRAYAELNVAATLGHKSDKAVGGEAGFRLTPMFDLLVEGGHIGNAATSDLDARATAIANAVGASANTIAKVNYFDVGVRYHLPVNVKPTVHPYLAVGVGIAQVTTQTTLSQNEDLVQFGSDLNGTEKSPFFMIGGGVNVDFAKRYFVDLTYRFGLVFQKTSGGDVVLASIGTNRVQAGLGVRF
jgi:opacity protein-like surface antigen